MAHISSQPLENLDLIVDCIDDPKDLTALALTCRRLADVLHPWYTEFRHIRCTYTSAFVWQALAASPALARRVRVLNICRSVGEATPPRIPEILCRSYAGSSYPVAEPDVAVASLRAALKEMWYLQSFHWHEERNSADASNGDAHEDGDIWSPVSDCKNLILLSVREYSSCFLRRCSVFASMLALRSFSYMTGAKSLQVDLRMLANMLQTQCPNLERIHMAFENDGSEMYDDENPAFEIGSTILAGRWRALRSVRFEFARCSVEQAIAFFEAHPTLTEVRVDYAFASDDQLWPQRLPCLPGLLPNLHGLECDAEQAADILSCPVDSPRPLQWIKLNWIGGPEEDVYDRVFFKVLSGCKMLKRVDILYPTLSYVRLIAQSIPWVQEIQCGQLRPLVYDCESEDRKAQWQELVAMFDDLRSFRQIVRTGVDSWREGLDLLAIIQNPTPGASVNGQLIGGPLGS